MAIMLPATVNNDHPFQCNVCGSQYRGSRWAAKCCKKSCTDIRNGKVTVYSDEAEAEARKMEAALREVQAKRYHYECSCGERFHTVGNAIGCRKCHTYTEEGRCTAVIDLNTKQQVWPDPRARDDGRSSDDFKPGDVRVWVDGSARIMDQDTRWVEAMEADVKTPDGRGFVVDTCPNRGVRVCLYDEDNGGSSDIWKWYLPWLVTAD